MKKTKIMFLFVLLFLSIILLAYPNKVYGTPFIKNKDKITIIKNI